MSEATAADRQLAEEILQSEGVHYSKRLDVYASLIARHTSAQVSAAVVEATAEKDRLQRQRDELLERLAKIQDVLETAVCTEDPDKGVVLLSDHGTTHIEYIDGRMVFVCDHEFFSPLGDALIAAWHLTQETEIQNER